MDKDSSFESTYFGMNTEIAHRAFGRHGKEALRAVDIEAKRLERMLSRFIPGSDVYRINSFAGRNGEKINSETYEILSKAIEISRSSQGLFDATIGPLADLWDFKNSARPPAVASLRQLLPLVDYRDLELDMKKRRAGLRRSGQSVDLGGIGKGFAGDRFIEIFKEYGIVSAFSNIGGNVSTLGVKPDGSPWKVGIRHPRQNTLLGAVEIKDRSAVTSGDYERYFIGREGRRYHHILNPVTGYPAQSGLISVTVVADSAMAADALSTAVFVAGLDKGLEILEKYPGAEAVMVDEKLEVYATGKMQGCFYFGKEIKTNFL